MNDLKQLKDIHIDGAKKQRDFDKVSARLQKSTVPWQVPIVLLGVVMIGFFLLLTWNEQPQTTADKVPELTAVYSVYGEGNPYSIWQIWVTRSTDVAVLKEYAAVLNEAKRVEAFDDTLEVSETYRFVYSDGTYVKYEAYYDNNENYFYDVNNALSYEITNKTHYYMIAMMDDYSDAKQYVRVLIIAFIIYLIASYFVGRKMRDEDDKKKSLPQHSTHWQTVVTASAIVLITILAFTVPNLHYFIAILIFCVATIVNILLERRFGKNGWRMLNIVVNNCWSVLILMNLFLI
ncbi:MAG: hypothetical protein ABS951_09405 [Solibacillus sp.]